MTSIGTQGLQALTRGANTHTSTRTQPGGFLSRGVAGLGGGQATFVEAPVEAAGLCKLGKGQTTRIGLVHWPFSPSQVEAQAPEP